MPPLRAPTEIGESAPNLLGVHEQVPGRLEPRIAVDVGHPLPRVGDPLGRGVAACAHGDSRLHHAPDDEVTWDLHTPAPESEHERNRRNDQHESHAEPRTNTTYTDAPLLFDAGREILLDQSPWDIRQWRAILPRGREDVLVPARGSAPACDLFDELDVRPGRETARRPGPLYFCGSLSLKSVTSLIT